ncbi:MAG: 50S ribosomal protein L4 [Deltaproteobacteria bacterium]|nr:50S ribosomal protein L4 [Deltaproteobacteria bacterium]
MLTQPILGTDNKELKKIELNKAIFGVPVRRQLLYDCVQLYQAAKRQGTAKAKFRGEVKGSSKKIYKQKGTGNARHGSIRANVFVGGGVAFPPRPRDWSLHLPKSFRQEALKSALALRLKESNLILIDAVDCKQIKTKDMVKQLAKWGVKKVLIILDAPQEKLWKSVRNIPYVEVITAQGMNALDVLRFEKVIMTEKAVAQIEKRLL